MIEPATPADIAVFTEQLGRPPRGLVGVGARCVCGRPTVAVTAPRLEDGSPFPTLYYLTSPGAVAAASALEAAGRMRDLAAVLDEPDVADAYRAAHEQYMADRAALGDVPELAGISAGGMPDRVKCLHALIAHSLVAGPGVNPIGDLALAEVAPVWRPDRCTC